MVGTSMSTRIFPVGRLFKPPRGSAFYSKPQKGRPENCCDWSHFLIPFKKPSVIILGGWDSVPSIYKGKKESHITGCQSLCEEKNTLRKNELRLTLSNCLSSSQKYKCVGSLRARRQKFFNGSQCVANSKWKIRSERFGTGAAKKKNFGVRRRKKRRGSGEFGRILIITKTLTPTPAKPPTLFFYLTRNTGPGPYVLALGEVLQRLSQLSDGCILHPPLPTDGVLHPSIVFISLISPQKKTISVSQDSRTNYPHPLLKKNTGESK